MSEKYKTWAYGDYVIVYHEGRSLFVVNQGDEEDLAAKPTLRAAQEYCDGRDKRLEADKNKRSDPVEVYYIRHGNDILVAKLTSFCDDGRAWINYEVANSYGRPEKERTKVYGLSDLKVKNAASEAIVAEIKELNRQSGEIDKEIYELKAKLVTVKPPQVAAA